jgi:hypothetical protein
MFASRARKIRIKSIHFKEQIDARLRRVESRRRKIALADEIKDRGITVNGVLPSVLDTPANRANMPKADFTQWLSPMPVASLRHDVWAFPSLRSGPHVRVPALVADLYIPVVAFARALLTAVANSCLSDTHIWRRTSTHLLSLNSLGGAAYHIQHSIGL